MPLKFQRPKDLPEEIPIYHTTPRDFQADLIIKLTALATEKVAVFPVFKDEMVEYFPKYFGTIFDKEKNYEFKENRLEDGEYFEMKIPNLKDPESFVGMLREFFYGELDVIKKVKVSDPRPTNENRWLEFYWIANYFCEEDLVLKTAKRLACSNQNACLEMIVDTGAPETFVDQFKDLRIQAKKRKITEENLNDPYESTFVFKQNPRELIKMIIKPGSRLDEQKIKQLNELEYDVTLAVNASCFSVPVEIDENGKLRAKSDIDKTTTDGRKFYMLKNYKDKKNLY